jgi:hypothetical protein
VIEDEGPRAISVRSGREQKVGGKVTKQSEGRDLTRAKGCPQGMAGREYKRLLGRGLEMPKEAPKL